MLEDISQYLAFIGIAVSMLLIFVILDKDNNLYNKIVEEIQNKINKALNNSESKISQFQPEVIKIQHDESVDPQLKKRVTNNWGVINKRKVVLRLMKLNLSNKRYIESISIIRQAPLYTALFCLLVTGMYSWLILRGEYCPENVNVTIFYFTYLSFVTWFLAWIYRTIFFGCFIACNKTLFKMPKFRCFFTKHTTFSTLLFPVMAVFVIWFFAIYFMKDCCSIWIFIVLNILYLAAGIPCYLAKNPEEPITYINFYGQIVLIVVLSILTEVSSEWFQVSVIPAGMQSESRLRMIIFIFIFLNGFTVPVLLTLLWFSTAPFIVSLFMRIRLRFIQYHINRYKKDNSRK